MADQEVMSELFRVCCPLGLLRAYFFPLETVHIILYVVQTHIQLVEFDRDIPCLIGIQRGP